MDRREAGQRALAAVTALTAGSAAAQDGKTERTRLAVDSEAPPALGRRRDGNELSLAELADQVVVVCFWAAWCPHCRNELPFLEKLHLAGKGALTVVAVNVEDSPTFRRVARELADLKMTLTHDSNKTVARAWLHDGGVPYTLVVDRKRRVRTALYGWGDSGQTAVLAAVNASLADNADATPTKAPSSAPAPDRSSAPPRAPGRACGCPARPAAARSLRNTSAVTIASPSAVWRPITGTPRRSAIASRRCDSWFGCTTADSSSVSSTGWSKRTPVAASFSCRKRMSKAALCATSTVSCAKAWKAGSTCVDASAGRPPSRGGCRGSGSTPRGIARCGSTSCSKHSCRRSLPLTMRVAPIWMISSPCRRVQPGGLGVEHGVGSARPGGGRPARGACSAGWNRSKS